MNDVTAEKSLIGSLFLDNNIIADSSSIISKDAFHDKSLGMIYESILILDSNNIPVDLTTVNSKLLEMGSKIPTEKISDCLDIVPSSANYKYYADDINEGYRKRQLYHLSNKVIELVKSDKSTDICLYLEKEILKIGNIKTNDITIQDIVKETIEAVQGGRDNQGILSGFNKLDNIIGGYRGGEVHVIAGRPGSGKSALLNNIVNNVISLYPDYHTIINSLEMTRIEVMLRLISNLKKLSYSLMRKGLLSKITLKIFLDAAKFFFNTNLHINDDPSLNINDIKRVAINKKNSGKISLIGIDYLQLMKDVDKSDKYETITNVSRDIKLMAKYLNVPIIVVAQMNRDIEKRTDGNPKLSDLAGSGSIENDADSVTFLVPESEAGTVVRAHTLKNRHGKQGFVRFNFQGEFMSFTEI